MKNEKFEKFISVPKKIISNSRDIFYKSVFSIFPMAKKLLKTPIIKDNTFIVWEPCTKSHSEVVPGFAKYLLDLGFHVSVLVQKEHIKDGLFCKFEHENLSLNFLSTKQIKKFFKYADLSQIKGILVTSCGKLCNESNYDECYATFNDSIHKSKLFFVEHDIKEAVDKGFWNENLIMLRKMDYKNANPTPVNPHYFGEISVTDKNSDIVNFLTVGVIKPRKKNNETIIEAVQELHKKGITNFKVTVVGKGKIKDIPSEIQKYFDIKGRLGFKQMYDEIEKSDFLITSYDSDNQRHLRYITTGTSGNFQLIYGFLKPCIINKKYAPMNEFTIDNSILYDEPKDYADAMIKAMNLTLDEYKNMQKELQKTAQKIYSESLCNLKILIDKAQNG